ncbi:transmembrane signal receptor [Lithospermum erythrorhizon]|uniref:Transmembrane signal receptor n=1 Tax=Lithospermum erythrorhizon TaxID=34254 RepID=A0AAV3RNP3_LITER
MHHPTESNLCAVKRILRYLAGTLHQGIFISAAPSFSIFAYIHSDWVDCPQTRSYTSGYCVLFSGTLISWSSKKQPTVERYSTETEYRTLASVVAEITWLQMLLKDLHIILSKAPVTLCDNISATYVAYNPVLHSRSKHIAIDYHFVREKVLLGDLSCNMFQLHFNLLTSSLKHSPLPNSKLHCPICAFRTRLGLRRDINLINSIIQHIQDRNNSHQVVEKL